MYGHVIKQWVEEATTDGIRSTMSSISYDVHRGLYFLYFQSRLEDFFTNNTAEITKLYLNPEDIQWVSTAPRSMLPRYGDDAVVGTLDGSWDRFRVPIKETETFLNVKTAYHGDKDHKLLSSMRNGYEEVEADQGKTRTIRGVDIPDEIRLAVGSDGELLRWSGGLHRLSAARLLGIDRIPAYVVVWHADVDKEYIKKIYSNESDRS